MTTASTTTRARQARAWPFDTTRHRRVMRRGTVGDKPC